MLEPENNVCLFVDRNMSGEKMKLFRIGRWAAALIAVGLNLNIAAGNDISIKNGDFEGGSNKNSTPLNWKEYGKTILPPNENYCYSVIKADGKQNHALFMLDNNEQEETGITFTVHAREKLQYTLNLEAKTSREDKSNGAFMQIRFLPSNKFIYCPIEPGLDKYKLNELSGSAPAGTTAVAVYLYTHRKAKPEIIIDNLQLSSDPAKNIADYKTFSRDLCLDTNLIKDGKPAITIVIPKSRELDRQAAELVKAVKDKTGVELPVHNDAAGFDADTSKLPGNLLLLGNRNNNRYISSLYDRHYVILDRSYPGTGGSIVRTLHNPFADGHNIIFAGGSDSAGTDQAVKRLANLISSLPYDKTKLKVGWLADIVLGDKLQPPENAEKAILTESSPLYGSFGYFGWNSLSKNMALYYLTGDKKFAKEFLRLAFPDADARKYIENVDKELIEVKDDPLAGPYHYAADMMILYWDLIEESPVFTDADREKIVAAFFRQMKYWEKGAYRIFSYIQPAPKIGDRHAQREALALFNLCRYLNRYYPTMQAKKGLKAVRNFFAQMEKNGNVEVENGSLYWYNTSIAPMVYYMLLSGNSNNPSFLKSLKRLAEGQTILVNGSDNDWATAFAANEMMLKIAYLLDDQSFLDITKQNGFKSDRLLLGQAFLPEKPYSRHSLDEQAGKWNFVKPAGDAVTDKQHFAFGSYRSASTSKDSDFILLDGCYEWGRNLYHCLALLELRLAGVPLLGGHHNQVYVYNDGMYADKFPKFTEIIKAETLGNIIYFQGRIPDYNGYRLERTIWQELGRFTIFADTITAIKPGKNTTLEINWEFAANLCPSLKYGSEIELSVEKKQKRQVLWQLAAKEMMPLLTGPPNGNVYMQILQGLLIKTKKTGESCRLDFSVDKDYPGELVLQMLGSDNRAGIRIIFDGKNIVDNFPHYTAGLTEQQISLGKNGLKAGKHTLELVAAENSKLQPSQCFMAIKKLAIYGKDKSSSSKAYRLSAGKAMNAKLKTYSGNTLYQTTGNCAAMKLDCTFVPGETKTVFTVLAPADTGSGPIVVPYRSGMAARVPETAIIEKTGESTISLLTAEQFSIMNGDNFAGLGTSNLPLDMSWNFAKGELLVKCPEGAEIELAVDGPTEVKAEKTCKLETLSNKIRIKLTKGEHKLTGIRPAPETLTGIKAELAQAEKSFNTAPASTVTDSKHETAQPLAKAWEVKCGNHQVSNICSFPAPAGTAAVASGSGLYLISPDGKKEQIEMPSPIGTMYWWAACKLLLVGCMDDQVIALNTNRRRQWEFTSKMAPEVEKTGKFYWYKSTDFYPGVWGISSSRFLDGKEQAFIGSACTLEIIDSNGKLIKRIAEYWGPLNIFALVPQPDGSVSLAAGRAYSGSPLFNVVNNRKPDAVSYGFLEIPKNSDRVVGFTTINNTAIFCTDLDNDGKQEVVVTHNGAWNRVLVYDVQGKPLYQANLGPGEPPVAAYPSSPVGSRKNINNIIIADFPQSPRQIIVALSKQTLLSLDPHCKRLWSRELDSEPVLLETGAHHLFAACRNGDILQLDAAGRTVCKGQITGRPTAMQTIGNNLLVGSEQGEIFAFKLNKD